MKISKMISDLQEKQREHGDIEVKIFDPDHFVDGELVETEPVFCTNEEGTGKVQSMVIADRETVFAIAD